MSCGANVTGPTLFRRTGVETRRPHPIWRPHQLLKCEGLSQSETKCPDQEDCHLVAGHD